MLSRRERDHLTALTDKMSTVNVAHAPLHRRATRLTLQLARQERRRLILRCIGAVAVCVASGTTASPPVEVVLSVATLTLAPLILLDWTRLRANIAEERRDRARRWQNNVPRMVADLRDEILNGPVYAPRDEWFYWRWRSLSWWTTQLANLVFAASVALTLLTFHFPAWSAVIIASAYAMFLWTLEALLVHTFTLQRKAILDGLQAHEGIPPTSGHGP